MSGDPAVKLPSVEKRNYCFRRKTKKVFNDSNTGSQKEKKVGRNRGDEGKMKECLIDEC